MMGRSSKFSLGSLSIVEIVKDLVFWCCDHASNSMNLEFLVLGDVFVDMRETIGPSHHVNSHDLPDLYGVDLPINKLFLDSIVATQGTVDPMLLVKEAGAKVPLPSDEVPAFMGTGVSVPPAEVSSPAASSIPAIVSDFLGLSELSGAPAAISFAATFEAPDLPESPEISTDLPPLASSYLPKLPEVIPYPVVGA
ncbi:unnamed protein product [Ilex paraguariensis]|uniref:Uncharacterized protein n=1 Tax=Ilex paraguariensis TaxID=185542 RepID=A0ABC8TGT9_9AQUA